jgi:ketosteroid isomerase-like protein
MSLRPIWANVRRNVELRITNVTTDPEDVVRELFDAVDRLDFVRALATLADDVQSVNEMSRRWLRGKDAKAASYEQIDGEMSDGRSELSDLHTRVWGDTALVTLWLEQDYTHNGTTQHVSAPSSFLLRRDGDAWKIVLIHSIPVS